MAYYAFCMYFVKIMSWLFCIIFLKVHCTLSWMQRFSSVFDHFPMPFAPSLCIVVCLDVYLCMHICTCQLIVLTVSCSWLPLLSALWPLASFACCPQLSLAGLRVAPVEVLTLTTPPSTAPPSLPLSRPVLGPPCQPSWCPLVCSSVRVSLPSGGWVFHCWLWRPSLRCQMHFCSRLLWNI